MARFAGSNLRVQDGLSKALDLFASYVPLRLETKRTSEIEAAETSFRQEGFDFRYYRAHRFGYDDVLNGVEHMISDLRANGVEILTSTQLSALNRSGERFSLELTAATGPRTLTARTVILAMGRTGRALLEELGDRLQLPTSESHIEIGIRLEFPSEIWPQIDSCHNDLKLHYKNSRTFCVCKDGWLAPYRVGRNFLMEGHSDPDKKSGFTNLGIALRLPNNSPSALFETIARAHVQESGGLPIREPLDGFLGGSRTDPTESMPATINFWRSGSIRSIFPTLVFEELAEAVQKFAAAFLPRDRWPQVSVFAPELDFYWPCYQLDDDFSTQCPGCTSSVMVPDTSVASCRPSIPASSSLILWPRGKMRKGRYIFDALYGVMELPEFLWEVFLCPEFQRLREVRMCNINSLCLTEAQISTDMSTVSALHISLSSALETGL